MAETEPIRLVEVNGHFEDPEKNVIDRSNLIVRMTIKNDETRGGESRIVWTDKKVADSAKKYGARYYFKDKQGNYIIYLLR